MSDFLRKAGAEINLSHKIGNVYFIAKMSWGTIKGENLLESSRIFRVTSHV